MIPLSPHFKTAAWLFFFLAATLSPSQATAQMGTKRALIIAIGKYPPEGGWAALNSVRDTEFVKNVLLNQNFENKNITILTDSQATIAGMCDSFEKLISRVCTGDIIFVQFSSHGEQVEDDNGDEDDCLDESVVSYKAVSPAKANVRDYAVNQAGYLRDDKIGAFVNRLRAAAGPTGDVIVFMDLCHSGSGTRFRGKVRGDQPPLVSANFKCSITGIVDSTHLIVDKTASPQDETRMASFAVISACQAEEQDMEAFDDNGRAVGSLTLAMSRVFTALDTATTYRSLFAQLEVAMNQSSPGQHPVLEGNGIDRILWGGRFVKQKHFFTIDKILNGKKLQLHGGIPDGLDSGAGVAVYPANTVDTARIKAVTAGNIIAAQSFSSTALLKKDLDPAGQASSWVFITQPVYNRRPVIIKTENYSAKDNELIQRAFKDQPLIQFDGQPELILAKGQTTDSIRVAGNGYLYLVLPGLPAGVDSLRTTLQNYLQYTFLRDLNIRDTGANIDFGPELFKNGVPDSIRGKANIINGRYEFSEGDSIVVWVENRSSTPVWINIIDMQPNGIINAIFPSRRTNIYPEQLSIAAHSRRVFYRYPIGLSPPFGSEVFKIFAARQKIDLEYIATAKGQQLKKGNFSVLEKLFDHSYKLGIKGDPSPASHADGSIQSLLFQIKPR
jgi:hypothetical protein